MSKKQTIVVSLNGSQRTVSICTKGGGRMELIEHMRRDGAASTWSARDIENSAARQTPRGPTRRKRRFLRREEHVSRLTKMLAAVFFSFFFFLSFFSSSSSSSSFLRRALWREAARFRCNSRRRKNQTNGANHRLEKGARAPQRFDRLAFFFSFFFFFLFLLSLVHAVFSPPLPQVCEFYFRDSTASLRPRFRLGRTRNVLPRHFYSIGVTSRFLRNGGNSVFSFWGLIAQRASTRGNWSWRIYRTNIQLVRFDVPCRHFSLPNVIYSPQTVHLFFSRDFASPRRSKDPSCLFYIFPLMWILLDCRLSPRDFFLKLWFNLFESPNFQKC